MFLARRAPIAHRDADHRLGPLENGRRIDAPSHLVQQRASDLGRTTLELPPTQLTLQARFEFRDVFADGLTVAPRVRYVDNDSDVALYDYDRSEVGIQIRWEPR